MSYEDGMTLIGYWLCRALRAEEKVGVLEDENGKLKRQLKMERLYWKVQAKMYHHEVIGLRFFGGIENKARVRRLYDLSKKIAHQYRLEFERSISTGHRTWKIKWK